MEIGKVGHCLFPFNFLWKGRQKAKRGSTSSFSLETTWMFERIQQTLSKVKSIALYRKNMPFWMHQTYRLYFSSGVATLGPKLVDLGLSDVSVLLCLLLLISCCTFLNLETSWLASSSCKVKIQRERRREYERKRRDGKRKRITSAFNVWTLLYAEKCTIQAALLYYSSSSPWIVV